MLRVITTALLWKTCKQNMYYVEFFYCLLLFSRLLSTVMNTMKYFDDGIEWAGDHHETSYTSKVMEIPFLQPCSASDRKCVLEL